MRNFILPALLLFSATLFAGQETAAPPADHQKKDSVDYSSSKPRVKLGTITVGAGFTHFSGPYYRYPYGYWYTPYFWDPLWYGFPPLFHPGYFTGFPYSEDKGEVKLTAAPRDAEVFLDGAYAGTADHLKSIWLAPGAYNLTVKAEQHAPFERRIYVLTGKTLKINAAPGSEVKP